jgi:chaperonin GroES
MAIPIKPLADRVVAVREDKAERTAAGLYLPDAAKEKPSEAKVVAVGPDIKNVAVGDRVLFKEYMMANFTVHDTEYLIINEEDILATVAE